MITIVAAGAKCGYSHEDHLIRDNTDRVVGKRYKTLQAAKKAAAKQITLRGQDHPYAWIEYRVDGSDERYWA